MIDVSITGVYIRESETQFWLFWMMLVVFRASLPRLGRTPSWMKTSDQPALFLSAMEAVVI